MNVYRWEHFYCTSIPDVQTGKNGQENTTKEGEGHGEQQGEAAVCPDASPLETDHTVQPHLVYATRRYWLGQHVTNLHLQTRNEREGGESQGNSVYS